MCYDEKPVEIYTLKEGYNVFLNCFESHKERINFVAHHGRVFDYFHLLGYFARLKNITETFIDTRPLFKDLFPGNNKFSLCYLQEIIIDKTFVAHNEMNDCLALKSVVNVVIKEKADLRSLASTFYSIEEKYKRRAASRKNLKSLHSLISRGAITRSMACRCAAFRFTVEHLRRAHAEGGTAHAAAVLADSVPGGALSKAASVVKKISKAFSD